MTCTGIWVEYYPHTLTHTHTHVPVFPRRWASVVRVRARVACRCGLIVLADGRTDGLSGSFVDFLAKVLFTLFEKLMLMCIVDLPFQLTDVAKSDHFGVTIPASI